MYTEIRYDTVCTLSRPVVRFPRSVRSRRSGVLKIARPPRQHGISTIHTAATSLDTSDIVAGRTVHSIDGQTPRQAGSEHKATKAAQSSPPILPISAHFRRKTSVVVVSHRLRRRFGLPRHTVILSSANETCHHHSALHRIVSHRIASDRHGRGGRQETAA
jgi:hypothetical protein